MHNKKIYHSQNGCLICMPESFNTNISHQFFDYKITFVNSQRENTNLKGLTNWLIY